MLKMETIQIHQKAKTLFHCISKKLFNNLFYRFISLIFLFLLIITKTVNAENIYLNELYCNTNKIQLLDNDTNSISFKDTNFDKIISKIDKDLSNKKYNLLVGLSTKPSSGYNLVLSKSKIKKDKIYLHFNEIKPQKNSKVLTVLTHPFCLLNIQNLNEYKVKIKKN
tara:strand:- start:202 stop:702 length:501 start_codon:yes stop_codon:yes gene_type:complete